MGSCITSKQDDALVRILSEHVRRRLLYIAFQKDEKENPCEYSYKIGFLLEILKISLLLSKKAARYSTLQNSLLLPPFPEQPNTNGGVCVSLDITHLKELVLAAEREEMCKEGVKVRLGAKVEDLWIVRVVDVREYTKELAVDRPDGRGEGRVEGLVCVG